MAAELAHRDRYVYGTLTHQAMCSLAPLHHLTACLHLSFAFYVSTAVLLMVAGAVLAAESYPALPMATFMIGVPLYFWAIQKLFFNQRCSRSGPVMPAADQEVNVNVEDGGEEVERLPTAAEREFDHSMAIYLESLGAAMAITFSLTLAMWVLWMSGGLDENGEDKWWTEELRVE